MYYKHVSGGSKMTHIHVCEKPPIYWGIKGYLHCVIGVTPVSVSGDPQTAEEISSITQDKNSVWELAYGQRWKRLSLTNLGN